MISGLLTTIMLFALSGNSYATEKSVGKGACYVRHMIDSEPNYLERSFNCIIEKKTSPYGTLVSLNFLDSNKQVTRAEILEANKECDFDDPKQYKSCGRIDLFNKKKTITSVFSDMTVYANNKGETENSDTTFTKNTPNISTCSRYISMQESITVCYKPNAKNRNDVAKGFL